MSRLNGLPSNMPLPSREVANSAPLASASASSASRAPEQIAPRPAMTIGRSASAIIATIWSTIAGSGARALRRRHQVGRRRVVRQVREFLLLQVHRHAEHDRAALHAAM